MTREEAEATRKHQVKRWELTARVGSGFINQEILDITLLRFVKQVDGYVSFDDIAKALLSKEYRKAKDAAIDRLMRSRSRDVGTEEHLSQEEQDREQNRTIP